ncbi:peptidoglycan-binding protein [Streptomyces sp. NPDC001978]|uniref:peptidoglycan-binding domain-containing protein n=1 Tax=Streptomyces sp. NPDC001978 TaxID=3364627 RepID=UPI0036C3FD1F
MTDQNDQKAQQDQLDQQNEQGGTRCPQCGTPRAADNTPACACNREASDALRDTRTAEAAAAEDFDPLRIRPYVELEPYAEAESSVEKAGEGAAEATMALRAVPADALSAPMAPSASEPATTDLNLFEHDGAEPYDGGPEGAAGRPRRRSRRPLLLSVAGVAVAGLAAAGFASGMLSYETPTRDGAAPQELRQSVPDATTDAASAPASATHASAAPAPASAGPASSSPTPSTTGPSASPSPTASRSTQPTQTASLTSTTAVAPSAPAPVLRRGDQGPDVKELQIRLAQVNLFFGNANGNYDNRTENAVRSYQWSRGVTADELGVYGAATRASLESETSEP